MSRRIAVSSSPQLPIVSSTLGEDGVPVYADPNGTTLTTTGKASFDQWFHDTPGVNLSTPLAVQFVPLIGGLRYDNDAFFPINDELLGNEGREHNFHFTIVMDLGGVHSAETGDVMIDNLDLGVGKVYSLDIFFAERHTSASTFHIHLLGFDLCN